MLTRKHYGYPTLSQLDNIKPWKRERKKSTEKGNILKKMKKDNMMRDLGVSKFIGKTSEVRICN